MDNSVMSERSIIMRFKSALILCAFLLCPFFLCNGQQECNRGTYGASCLQTCHCRSGQCDRFTGVCTGSPPGCSSGWSGTNCQLECDQGTFGASCQQTCHCQSGQCNRYTGVCTGSPPGCSSGWTGTNCQACVARKFGTNCQQTCHCSSGECNIYTGQCTGTPRGCTGGWKGRSCQQECDQETFGASCQHTCHCQSGQCNRYTGVCTGSPTGCSSGWTGHNCQACVAGKFGRNCQHTCNCRSRECNIDTGHCTGTPTGCTNGWRGRTCQQECGVGTFGTNCDNTCHCQSGECNRFTGTCTGNTTDCTSGWRGSNCHQECGARTFGANCDNTCHCQSGECNRFTGKCTGRTRDCMSGWRGSSCHEALLTSAPEEVTKGSSLITISWPAWNGNTNARDPPVIGYIPYHKTSATEWIPGSLEPLQTLNFTFSDLTPDTNYSFSVSVVIEGNEEGPKSPERVVKTTCTDRTLEFDISSDLAESKASISTVYVVLVAGAMLILLFGVLIGSLVGRRCSNTAPFPQALNTTGDISAKDDPEYILSTEETKDDISHEYQDLSSKLDVSAKVISKEQSEEEPSHTYQEITPKSDEPDYLIPTERSRDKPYHEYHDEATSNVQKEKMMLESHVTAKSLLGEVEQDDESYEVPSALKKCTELYLNVPKSTKSKPIAQIEI